MRKVQSHVSEIAKMKVCRDRNGSTQWSKISVEKHMLLIEFLINPQNLMNSLNGGGGRQVFVFCSYFIYTLSNLQSNKTIGRAKTRCGRDPHTRFPRSFFVFSHNIYVLGSPFLRPCECHGSIIRKRISPAAFATRVEGYCYCYSPPEIENTRNMA